jgi:hypothetical protein
MTNKKDKIELDITKLKCWNCEEIGTIKKCFNVIDKEVCLACINCSASCDYNEVVEILNDIIKNKEIKQEAVQGEVQHSHQA